MMKRLFQLLILVLCCFAEVSCGDVVEGSNNGKLDGFWHLESVDTLGNHRTKSFSDQTVFMGVQGHILTWKNYENHVEYMFRFSYEQDSLRLYDPRINDREHGDPVVNDIKALLPFGIHTAEEQFKVDFIGKSQLLLTGKTLQLKLKRF